MELRAAHIRRLSYAVKDRVSLDVNVPLNVKETGDPIVYAEAVVKITAKMC